MGKALFWIAGLAAARGASSSSYSYSYECSYATDDCPYRGDEYCDVPDYCTCDVFDCDPCSQAVTCASCLAMDGCAFCQADLVCVSAALGDPPASYFEAAGKKVACDVGDYATSCAAASAVVPDPYYEAVAWYIEAMRVDECWAAGRYGEGIQIQVNDDGVDGSHPDLDKVSLADSCEIAAPRDSASEHGTHCAALAAGTSNSACAVGVAPGATLAACNIFNSSWEVWDDSYLYRFGDANGVSSNSWGIDACVLKAAAAEEARGCPFGDNATCAACDAEDWASGSLGETCEDAVVAYCYSSFEDDPEACLDYDRYFVACGYNQLSTSGAAALRRGVTEGRSGLGVVYVFAAGNEYSSGDDVNYEGYLNSRFTISVGAVGKDLRHASYSSVGAAVTVSAPGGDADSVHNMVTAFPLASGRADDCGDATIGTSFATPLVSGAVALILEANPALGWRDVQGIFAATAARVDSDDEDWAANAAGVRHSYKYGFGLVDAKAAVDAAEAWTPYPRETLASVKTTVGAALVDLPEDGEPNWVESSVDVETADLVVEHVACLVTIEARRPAPRAAPPSPRINPSPRRSTPTEETCASSSKGTASRRRWPGSGPRAGSASRSGSSRR